MHPSAAWSFVLPFNVWNAGTDFVGESEGQMVIKYLLWSVIKLLVQCFKLGIKQ